WKMEVWDVASGKLRCPPKYSTSSVYRIALSPDQANLVAAAADNKVRIWNATDSSDRCKLLSYHGKAQKFGSITSLAFSPDSKRLATTGVRGTVMIWDVSSGAELQSPMIPPRARRVTFLGCDFSPDGHGTRLATASDDGGIELWDTKSGKEWIE